MIDTGKQRAEWTAATVKIIRANSTVQDGKTVRQPTNYFNPLSVQLPEKFDFWQPHGTHGMAHMQGGNAARSSQNSIFIHRKCRWIPFYTLWNVGEDILGPLKLTDGQGGSYEEIAAAFEKHPVPSVNVIYERAKFNCHRQEVRVCTDVFITNLHKMTDKCHYTQLREKVIRDCLVAGRADLHCRSYTRSCNTR